LDGLPFEKNLSCCAISATISISVWLGDCLMFDEDRSVRLLFCLDGKKIKAAEKWLKIGAGTCTKKTRPEEVEECWAVLSPDKFFVPSPHLQCVSDGASLRFSSSRIGCGTGCHFSEAGPFVNGRNELQVLNFL